MRLNEHTGSHTFPVPISLLTDMITAISTPKLLLVPYSAHHVPTYHTWMQSSALQTATASEPLTLDQEYEMQRSWRTDADKLTFIICLPRPSCEEKAVEAELDDPPERMVGDVNLFLSPLDDGEEDGGEEEVVGEIELMIALPSLQNQGYGRAALLTFMSYVLAHWEGIARELSASTTRLAYLRAKINETNARSIGLFESVGFRRVGEGANYFGEVELRWRGSGEDLKGCKGWVEGVERRYHGGV